MIMNPYRKLSTSLMYHRSSVRILSLAIVAALAVAACGGGDGQSAEPVESTPPAVEPIEAITTTTSEEKPPPTVESTVAAPVAEAPIDGESLEDSPPVTSPAPRNNEPVEIPLSRAPRTVTDFFGNEIDIPGNPQAVLATDDTALSNLLDLGITPVGAAVNRNSVPDFLGDRMDGIADVSSPNDVRVNLEAAAALRPDLILTLGADWSKGRYDLISEIASTFGYEYGYASSDQLRTNMLDIGRALGMEAEAAGEVQKLDEHVSELRVDLDDAGITGEQISVLRVSSDGGLSLRHGSPETVLLDELGMSRPENQRDVEEFSTNVSEENIEQVDAYAVYVYVDDTAAAGAYDELLKSPLWQQLEAAENDRIFLVDGGVWNGISLAAAHEILNDIERTLVAR